MLNLIIACILAAILGFVCVLHRRSVVDHDGFRAGFYLLVETFAFVTTVQFWSQANAALSLRQARRLYVFVGTGRLLDTTDFTASWASQTQTMYAIRDGTIDAICSDHAPVDDDEKLLPFGEASPGATGLELLLSLALTWADECVDPSQHPVARAKFVTGRLRRRGQNLQHLTRAVHRGSVVHH